MNESGDAGHPAFLVLEHEHKNVQECWSMGPGLLLAWSASVLTMIGAFFILCGGGTTPVIREYNQKIEAEIGLGYAGDDDWIAGGIVRTMHGHQLQEEDSDDSQGGCDIFKLVPQDSSDTETVTPIRTPKLPENYRKKLDSIRKLDRTTKCTLDGDSDSSRRTRTSRRSRKTSFLNAPQCNNNNNNKTENDYFVERSTSRKSKTKSPKSLKTTAIPPEITITKTLSLPRDKIPKATAFEASLSPVASTNSETTMSHLNLPKTKSLESMISCLNHSLRSAGLTEASSSASMEKKEKTTVERQDSSQNGIIYDQLLRVLNQGDLKIERRCQEALIQGRRCSEITDCLHGKNCPNVE